MNTASSPPPAPDRDNPSPRARGRAAALRLAKLAASVICVSCGVNILPLMHPVTDPSWRMLVATLFLLTTSCMAAYCLLHFLFVPPRQTPHGANAKTRRRGDFELGFWHLVEVCFDCCILLGLYALCLGAAFLLQSLFGSHWIIYAIIAASLIPLCAVPILTR
jgi:hypothetical protein